MSSILILNQPQVAVGPQTLTYTITTAGGYNIQVQGTFPSAVATGDGAGSGTGLGSGAGGGGTGFVGGGNGPGAGGVGQGFGPTNGYQQPPAYGSNQTSGPAVSSSITITIIQNGSTIYTSPALAPTQGGFKFSKSFLGAVNDAMVVTISSAAAVDNQLNTVQTITTIGQGL